MVQKGDKMEFTIIQRERTTFLDARHNPVDGYRVTFELADGTIDWVDVPKSMYNKKNVDKAIAKAVERHADVSG